MQRRFGMLMSFPVAFIFVSVLVAAQQAGVSATDGFNELTRVVRSAGPVRVESSLVLESSIGAVVERTDPLVAVYVLDGPGRGLVRLKGWRLTADAGHVIIEHDQEPDAFVRLEQAGSPLASIRTTLKSLPDPYLAFSLGSDDPVSLLEELHDEPLGLVPVESGSDSLLCTGDSSTLELSLDAVGRPVRGTLVLTGGQLPEEVELRWNWTWTHTSLSRDELEAAMQFDRRGRQRLDSPLALRQRADRAQSGLELSGGLPLVLDLDGDDGERVRLASFRGQVVLIEFWASWCSPCMRSLPALQDRVKQWLEEGRKVVLLTVNTLEAEGEDAASPESSIQRAHRVRRAYGIEAPILLDTDDSTAREWDVTALPAVFVIDSAGRIVTRVDGYGPGAMEQLEMAVEAALAEQGESTPGDGSQ